jgi:hypothetical protein
MTSYTIRLRPHTYRALCDLAQATGESPPAVVARLVDESRRSLMFQRAAEAYAAVGADPVEDAAWRAEIALWDVTAGDGLEEEPWEDPWDKPE